MPQYDLLEVDLSIRTALAVEMLMPIPLRPWGRATELAQTYGISRPLLYKFRDRVLEAIQAALAPRPPGPQPQRQEVVIDRDFLRRAITVILLPPRQGT